MRVQKWLHISETGGDAWVLRIRASIDAAVSEGRIAEVARDVHELALYVSTRLNMLPRIVDRINHGCNVLYQKVRSAGQSYVFTEDKEGCAWEIDGDLKYQLLIDIDSLLFELNSCCELMCKFVFAIYDQTGMNIDEKDIGREIKNIVEQEGEDAQWFVELDDKRNFFMHEGAPYIAVDLSRESEYDLLVMKENLRRFDDESKFLRLSRLKQIVDGFLAARGILQEHLVQHVDNLGRN